MNEISFPNPALFHPKSGIVAYGGDLSPERLWHAYNIGIFPWFNEGEEILWWCPDPRFVLFPNELKISKSMRKILKDNIFRFTENKCFDEVIERCASIKREGQDGTWITEEMKTAYKNLYRLGRAKSVEVWKNGELAGGFYGVDLETIFCGESMFSEAGNASKAGFIWFVQKYKNIYEFIDCQTYTTHLESLGARMIPKLEFLKYLNKKAEG